MKRTISTEKAIIQAMILGLIAPHDVQAKFSVAVAEAWGSTCEDGGQGAYRMAQKQAPAAADALRAALEAEGTDLSDAFKEHMDNLLQMSIVELPVLSVPEM